MHLLHAFEGTDDELFDQVGANALVFFTRLHQKLRIMGFFFSSPLDRPINKGG